MALSKPRSPLRQAAQTPCSSSGKALTNGVLQTAQKNSASSAAGDEMHSGQTGTRVQPCRGRLHRRQSLGKSNEKRPWGSPRSTLKAPVLVSRLLEKAHLLIADRADDVCG